MALSLATDLGTGQPMEHGLRTCWLSLRTAEALGLDAAARSCVYYVALLRFLGCTSDAADTAVLAGGDDVGVQRGDGPDADGPARRGDALLRAPPGRGPPGPSPRRAGGAGADRPGHDRAQPVATLRGRVPPGGPGRAGRVGVPGAGSRLRTLGRQWATRTAWPATRCRSRYGSCRWPGTPSCGNGGPGGRRRSRCWTHRRGHGYDPAVVDVVVEGGREWLGDVADDPCAVGARCRAGTGGDDRPGWARRGAWRRWPTSPTSSRRGCAATHLGWPRWWSPPPGAAGLPDDHAVTLRPGGVGARRRARRGARTGSGIVPVRSAPSSGNGSACTRI